MKSSSIMLHGLFVIFDCPQQGNDKSWLYENLKMLYRGTVIPVYAPCVLSTLYRRGLWGFFLYRWFLWRQAFSTIFKSSKGDGILCWGEMTGYMVWLIKRLFHLDRKVILMNWLSPNEKIPFYYKSIQCGIARDGDCQIIVNTQESISEWCDFLKTNRREGFHFVPDVYDIKVPFKDVVLREKNYFFSGGITNRDWLMVSQLASEMPRMTFVCVALKKDFCSKVKFFPSNLQVYYDLPVECYYRLLSDAYAVLLPLEEKTVSGLINIIRSAQEGIPCIVTRTAGTEQYYPKALQGTLMCEYLSEWKASLEKLLSMDNTEYMELSNQFQSYIRDSFSPLIAASDICKVCVSNLNYSID